jgi:hypothetical protein
MHVLGRMGKLTFKEKEGTKWHLYIRVVSFLPYCSNREQYLEPQPPGGGKRLHGWHQIIITYGVLFCRNDHV